MKSPTTPVHLAGAKLRVSTSLKKKMSVGVAQGNEGKDRVITVCVLISKTSSISVSDCSAHFSGLSLYAVSPGVVYFSVLVSPRPARYVTGHSNALLISAPAHRQSPRSLRQGTRTQTKRRGHFKLCYNCSTKDDLVELCRVRGYVGCCVQGKRSVIDMEFAGF